MEIAYLNNTNQIAAHIGNYWLGLQNSTKNDLLVCPDPSTYSEKIFDWIVTNYNSINNWEKLKVYLQYDLLQGEADIQYLDIYSNDSFFRNLRNHFSEPLRQRNLNLPINNIIEKPILSILEQYNEKIEENRGFDLLTIVPGPQGTYARVMPNLKNEKGYHLIKLIPELTNIGPTIGTVSSSLRRYAMSIGPKTLKSAKKIFITPFTSEQHDLVVKALDMSYFDPQFPISIINELASDKIEIISPKDYDYE